MTTIESKEIRGITLRILYLLVAFAVVSTAGIMTSYFGLKNDNQLLATQIEILKIQYKIIDQRLEKIENKRDRDNSPKYPIEINASNEKQTPSPPAVAAIYGLQNPPCSNQ